SFIMYNPDDPRPLSEFGINTMPTVDAGTPLFDILNTFQEGRSHMAIVVKGEQSIPIGIITLEDVLEELIQEEIYDESDKRVGLAVKLETGDQLILASKKRRTNTSNQNVILKNKFKSSSRNNTDLPSSFKTGNGFGIPDANIHSDDLIVFDEPTEPTGSSQRVV
ncbi:14746_t:CDS:1, partial [Acaulospora morrowiae]